jgi:hypothetical protein
MPHIVIKMIGRVNQGELRSNLSATTVQCARHQPKRDTALLIRLRAIAAYIRLAILCSFLTLHKYYTIFFIVFQIGDDDGV